MGPSTLCPPFINNNNNNDKKEQAFFYHIIKIQIMSSIFFNFSHTMLDWTALSCFFFFFFCVFFCLFRFKRGLLIIIIIDRNYIVKRRSFGAHLFPVRYQSCLQGTRQRLTDSGQLTHRWSGVTSLGSSSHLTT